EPAGQSTRPGLLVAREPQPRPPGSRVWRSACGPRPEQMADFRPPRARTGKIPGRYLRRTWLPLLHVGAAWPLNETKPFRSYRPAGVLSIGTIRFRSIYKQARYA